MLNLDTNLLADVTRAALTHAANEPRWVRAIENAVIEIEDNPYIAMVDADLIIASSTSGEVYRVTRYCNCMAGMNRKPCKHRAIKRLLQLYDQARDNKT